MKPLDYYASLDAIDLARDSDFRAWIRQPKPVQNQFWESFEALYPHQQATLEQARLLVRGLESAWQDIPDNTVEASFQRLRQKQLSGNRSRNTSFLHRSFTGMLQPLRC